MEKRSSYVVGESRCVVGESSCLVGESSYVVGESSCAVQQESISRVKAGALQSYFIPTFHLNWC